MPLALALATTTIAGHRVWIAASTGSGSRTAGRNCSAVRSTDRSRPAEVAWSLALDRADQLPPAGLARPLLALAALLDPAGVPVQVAASRATCGYLSRHGRGMPADQQEVMTALGGLAECGLVTIDQTAGPGLVAVHPVVQDTVRRLVPASVLDDAARSAADAIAEVWPQLEGDPEYEQALRGCAGWLGGIAGDLLWLPEPHPVLIKAGQSLGQAGLAGAAVAYWKSMLAASGRALGPDHPRTLVMRDQLAAACEDAGRLDEARELIVNQPGRAGAGPGSRSPRYADRPDDPGPDLPGDRDVRVRDRRVRPGARRP